MLNKIIYFSIKNKLAIGIFTLMLIIWGVYSLSKLPIDAVPDITNNQVQIITNAPTLASQEVEQFVTYPIEQSLANLPDLTEIRSISRFGLSVVTVVFHDDVDVYFARQLINERLKDTQEDIPAGMANRVLGIVNISTGGITGTIADPRVILAAALKANACGIIIAHNHPSGNLQPSQADKDLTVKLREGAEWMDIKMLDHIIVSKEGYYSFSDMQDYKVSENYLP